MRFQPGDSVLWFWKCYGYPPKIVTATVVETKLRGRDLFVTIDTSLRFRCCVHWSTLVLVNKESAALERAA